MPESKTMIHASIVGAFPMPGIAEAVPRILAELTGKEY